MEACSAPMPRRMRNFVSTPHRGQSTRCRFILCSTWRRMRSLYVNMVVELVQTVRVPLDDSGSRFGAFPITVLTLLISQILRKGRQTLPRIRICDFEASHPEREERAHLRRCQRAGVGDEKDDAYFRINFGSPLHAGV
jgi:hypothetical protein